MGYLATTAGHLIEDFYLVSFQEEKISIILLTYLYPDHACTHRNYDKKITFPNTNYELPKRKLIIGKCIII